jgi:hypothetical protein
VAYEVRFPISGFRIDEIKELGGISSEEAISVSKEEDDGVIRAETWVELLGICFRLMERLSDFEFTLRRSVERF